ncbi:hypothetical protein JZO86_03935 [Enterococcus ureasiticus]|uniref:hypothetical protein n=1 Tax=Enterococcus ureasiticus TaxID=903984 RepID=UPI001A8EAC28|nr:hypothetical protein [Enterococcus ureasiticus]MBO0472854.1 hypothetical protein [Enterococcus ureasiticus]
MKLGDRNKIKNSVIGNHNQGGSTPPAESKFDKLLLSIIGGILIAIVVNFLNLG